MREVHAKDRLKTRLERRVSTIASEPATIIGVKDDFEADGDQAGRPSKRTQILPVAGLGEAEALELEAELAEEEAEAMSGRMMAEEMMAEEEAEPMAETMTMRGGEVQRAAGELDQADGEGEEEAEWGGETSEADLVAAAVAEVHDGLNLAGKQAVDTARKICVCAVGVATHDDLGNVIAESTGRVWNSVVVSAVIEDVNRAAHLPARGMNDPEEASWHDLYRWIGWELSETKKGQKTKKRKQKQKPKKKRGRDNEKRRREKEPAETHQDLDAVEFAAATGSFGEDSDAADDAAELARLEAEMQVLTQLRAAREHNVQLHAMLLPRLRELGIAAKGRVAEQAMVTPSITRLDGRPPLSLSSSSSSSSPRVPRRSSRKNQKKKKNKKKQGKSWSKRSGQSPK